jgi:hypothetical protein
MEVAMTRTAIRHTLSAIAAAALISAFATGAVAGGMRAQHLQDEMMGSIKGHTIKKPETERLATQTPSQQAPTRHYQFRWWQDYGGGAR